MRNFQQEKGWRNIMQSKVVLILLGILILFFAYSVLGFWNKMNETSKNKKRIEDKIVELRKSKATFESEISDLATDKGKEESIREKYSVVKEGEEVIVIVEDKNKKEAPKNESSSGFFSFFKNLFK